VTEMAELLLPGSFSSGTLYLARLTGSVWLAGMFSTKDVNSRENAFPGLESQFPGLNRDCRFRPSSRSNSPSHALCKALHRCVKEVKIRIGESQWNAIKSVQYCAYIFVVEEKGNTFV